MAYAKQVSGGAMHCLKYSMGTRWHMSGEATSLKIMLSRAMWATDCILRHIWLLCAVSGHVGSRIVHSYMGTLQHCLHVNNAYRSNQVLMLILCLGVSQAVWEQELFPR